MTIIEPLPRYGLQTPQLCIADDDEPVFARGLCSAHYNRWWRDKTNARNKGNGTIVCASCGKPMRNHSITSNCPE